MLGSKSVGYWKTLYIIYSCLIFVVVAAVFAIAAAAQTLLETETQIHYYYF